MTTAHGERAIQTLHVGDVVQAENPATGKVAAEAVQAVIQDPISPLIAVDLSDGSAITTTVTHAFWVDEGASKPGWLEAGRLRVGDRLREADGAEAVVAGLRRNVGRAVVYTLTVAKDHTFFVGTAQVLVHNATCSYIRQEIQDALSAADRRVQEPGIVADFLDKHGYDIRLFNQPFLRPDAAGPIGDVDIEIDKAIVEITVSPQGKRGQIAKLLSNKTLNPSGKPVILFSRDYTPTAAREVKQAGGIVVRSEQELLQELQKL